MANGIEVAVVSFYDSSVRECKDRTSSVLPLWYLTSMADQL